MPKIPNPYEAPLVWETLVLRTGGSGRVIVPGIVNVEVSGGIRESRQDAPGENGARATFLGYRDAEITITANAATSAEFDALTTVLELFRTPRGRTASPVVSPSDGAPSTSPRCSASSSAPPT